MLKKKYMHTVDSPSFLCSEVDGSGSMLRFLVGGVLWMLCQPLKTIQVIYNIRLGKGGGGVSKIDITNPQIYKFLMVHTFDDPQPRPLFCKLQLQHALTLCRAQMHGGDVIGALLRRRGAQVVHKPLYHLYSPKTARQMKYGCSFRSSVLNIAFGILQQILQAV